jgi:hypothetical protein
LNKGDLVVEIILDGMAPLRSNDRVFKFVPWVWPTTNDGRPTTIFLMAES